MPVLYGDTDLTMTLHGEVSGWLPRVRKKFGERFAQRCGEMIGNGSLENGLGQIIMERVIQEQQPLLSKEAFLYFLEVHYSPEMAEQVARDGSVMFQMTPSQALKILAYHLEKCGVKYRPAPMPHLQLYAWNPLVNAAP